MKKRNDYEHREQAALIQWRDLQIKVIPELRGLWATPNGGKRDIRIAMRMKAEGCKRGVPDLFLAVARCNYHGLFIEMKSPGERLSKEQEEMKEFLESQKFLVLVCYSSCGARQVIVRYLKG